MNASTRTCGAGAPARETSKPKQYRGSANAIFVSVLRGFTLFTAALKEIFDETAYQRFLHRSNLQSSSNAYAIFQQENEQAKSTRPRCC